MASEYIRHRMTDRTLTDDQTPGEIKEFFGHLGLLATNMQDAVKRINRYMLFFKADGVRGEFRSVEDAVLEIVKANSDISVTIDESSSKDFEILFPHSILIAIFEELLRNSKTHGSASEVRISWEAVGGTVRLVFDDNGSGISHIVDDETELFTTSIYRENGEGLNIINSVIRLLDGVTTVSRAPELGGARFVLMLKPKIFWIDGELRHFKG